ncbi:hypothetical protein NDU88_004975 [Pleurodeles waltl]|uniref:Uncharacterized protein n=1 Tax=Pleurodeles waltl TaxID=8319 RepID=A0AAV7N4J4_PLEWA|nr:hypothetical protein NDU88_004975 [Pleurodeles waltl]
MQSQPLGGWGWQQSRQQALPAKRSMGVPAQQVSKGRVGLDYDEGSNEWAEDELHDKEEVGCQRHRNRGEGPNRTQECNMAIYFGAGSIRDMAEEIQDGSSGERQVCMATEEEKRGGMPSK